MLEEGEGERERGRGEGEGEREEFRVRRYEGDAYRRQSRYMTREHINDDIKKKYCFDAIPTRQIRI